MTANNIETNKNIMAHVLALKVLTTLSNAENDILTYINSEGATTEGVLTTIKSVLEYVHTDTAMFDKGAELVRSINKEDKNDAENI